MTNEAYYRHLRHSAYRATEKFFSGNNSLELTEIDAKAVNASYDGQYTWAWDDDDNATLAARFEVAVWEKSRLTGLCRGKPIEHNSKLCLEIVEAAPTIPLSERSYILPIIGVCVSVYAKMIGAKQIRLMEPTSKSRVRLYERLGFKSVAAGYMVKEVKQV